MGSWGIGQPCEGPRGIVNKYASEDRYFRSEDRLSPVERLIMSNRKFKIIV